MYPHQDKIFEKSKHHCEIRIRGELDRQRKYEQAGNSNNIEGLRIFGHIVVAHRFEFWAKLVRNCCQVTDNILVDGEKAQTTYPIVDYLARDVTTTAPHFLRLEASYCKRSKCVVLFRQLQRSAHVHFITTKHCNTNKVLSLTA